MSFCTFKIENITYSTYIFNHTGRIVSFLLPFSCTIVPVGSCQGILFILLMWLCGSHLFYPEWNTLVAPDCAQSWIPRRTNSQVNTLHSCSFLCLAVSAASFAYRWVWPARAALAIPFLLSAAQGLKPDSPESLAVRLWEERVTQGFTTSGINSKIKRHVVLSDKFDT